MQGAGPVGRAATAQDVPAATACLASAFFEDPLWGDWTFPDRSCRERDLYRLLEAWVSAGVRHPWVRMTPGAEAVAVWIPPAVPEMTSEEEHAFDALLDDLFRARAPELAGLMEQFNAHHPRHEPHYYLSLWGTHSDHRGRGVGSALIGECLAQIDAERMPAYLESTNPANLPRYEALGFRPVGEFGPADGPTVTTMWRDARP